MSDAKVIALIAGGALVVLAIAIPSALSDRRTNPQAPITVAAQPPNPPRPTASAPSPPDAFTIAAKGYHKEQERRKQALVDWRRRVVEDIEKDMEKEKAGFLESVYRPQHRDAVSKLVAAKEAPLEVLTYGDSWVMAPGTIGYIEKVKIASVIAPRLALVTVGEVGILLDGIGTANLVDGQPVLLGTRMKVYINGTTQHGSDTARRKVFTGRLIGDPELEAASKG